MTEKERIQKIKDFFPDAHQTSNDYRTMIEQIILPVISLLPKNPNEDKAILGNNININSQVDSLIDKTLDEEGMNEKEVFKDVTDLLQGSANWASPLSMNIIPQSNFVAIPSFLIASIFSPTILENDLNSNLKKAEYEVGTMLSDLAWDTMSNTGCVFTYGPEAGWIYALQYAKNRVLKNSSKEGLFNKKGKVICSSVAQIAKERAIALTGIGTDNLIQISVDQNNKINLTELKSVLINLKKENIPVLCVVATIGTKNVNAFDSVKDIYDLLQEYPNNENDYGKALIYVDANLSFTWLAFKDYDFNKNSLGFNEKSLPIIKNIYDSISEIKYADCFSTDFHLTSYCPGSTSSFHFKDANEYKELMVQNNDFNDVTPYLSNGIHSTIGAISAWATLKYFGKNGFRLINGQQIQYGIEAKEIINGVKNFKVLNANSNDENILFRIYSNEDAENEYIKEKNNKEYKDELLKNNDFNLKVYQKLYTWYKTCKQIDNKYTPYIAFIEDISKTNYNLDNNSSEKLNCLKIFTSQFNATLETINWLVECIKLAIIEINKEEK